jgi:hypothetical protein
MADWTDIRGLMHRNKPQGHWEMADSLGSRAWVTDLTRQVGTDRCIRTYEEEVVKQLCQLDP